MNIWDIIFSSIEFYAGICLSNELIRLPIGKYKVLKMLLISLFFGFESVLSGSYLPNGAIGLVVTLILWVFTLVQVFKISFFYSLLISVITALFTGGLELLGFVVASSVVERYFLDIADSLGHVIRNTLIFCVSLIIFLTSYFFSKMRFGLLFPNIKGNPVRSKWLFITYAAIFVGILTEILLTAYLSPQAGVMHIIGSLMMITIAAYCIVYAYKFNKVVIREKINYSRTQINENEISLSEDLGFK